MLRHHPVTSNTSLCAQRVYALHHYHRVDSDRITELILTAWIALACPSLGCGAVHFAASIPRPRPSKAPDRNH
jgi:hypothetical protein